MLSLEFNYTEVFEEIALKEIYIDDVKKVVLKEKPSFDFEITHTEHDTQLDIKKIWLKLKTSEDKV